MRHKRWGRILGASADVPSTWTRADHFWKTSFLLERALLCLMNGYPSQRTNSSTLGDRAKSRLSGWFPRSGWRPVSQQCWQSGTDSNQNTQLELEFARGRGRGGLAFLLSLELRSLDALPAIMPSHHLRPGQGVKPCPESRGREAAGLLVNAGDFLRLLAVLGPQHYLPVSRPTRNKLRLIWGITGASALVG